VLEKILTILMRGKTVDLYVAADVAQGLTNIFFQALALGQVAGQN
jgi:hypothetical protein